MPLSDLRILDLSRLLPGPFCSLIFADLGADVIKVEDLDGGDYLRWMPPRSGDQPSAMFTALNRNKRSLRLNLKSDAGREAFLRLARTTDVVIESFRPGVMDRLGLGWSQLSAANPRLVLCSISGYGQDGPYRDRAGHDLNYAAIAGMASLTGTRDGTLAVPGVQVGDLGGGAMSAAIAVLAALHERQRTGRGRHLDIAMLDGIVSWLGPHLAAAAATGDPAGPAGMLLNGRHPCYALHRCADGWMSVAALEPKFWHALVEALELPHLRDAAFAAGEEAAPVFAELESVFTTRSRAQWAEQFRGRDVCCEPVLHLDEVLQNEQVRARGLHLGDLQIATPVRFDGAPPLRPAPGYGEHTREVLAAAGYPAADIDALISAGAAA